MVFDVSRECARWTAAAKRPHEKCFRFEGIDVDQWATEITFHERLVVCDVGLYERD